MCVRTCVCVCERNDDEEGQLERLDQDSMGSSRNAMGGGSGFRLFGISFVINGDSQRCNIVHLLFNKDSNGKH